MKKLLTGPANMLLDDAISHLHSGQLKRALLASSRCIDILATAPDSQQRATTYRNALNVKGLSHWGIGDFSSASEALESALRVASRQSRDGGGHDAFLDIGGVINDIGCLKLERGDLDGAEQSLKRCMYLGSRAHVRDRDMLAAAKSNMAELVHTRGDQEEAERQYVAAYASAGGCGPHTAALVGSNFCKWLLQQGRSEEAAGVAQEAAQLTQHLPQPQEQALAVAPAATRASVASLVGTTLVLLGEKERASEAFLEADGLFGSCEKESNDSCIDLVVHLSNSAALSANSHQALNQLELASQLLPPRHHTIWATLEHNKQLATSHRDGKWPVVSGGAVAGKWEVLQHRRTLNGLALRDRDCTKLSWDPHNIMSSKQTTVPAT